MTNRKYLGLVLGLILSVAMPIYPQNEGNKNLKLLREFAAYIVSTGALVLLLILCAPRKKTEQQKEAAPSKPASAQQCGICLEQLPATHITTLHCNHGYCRACLQHIITNGINEKSFIGYRCPHCNEQFNLEDVLKIATEDQLERIERLMLEKSIVEKKTPSGDPGTNPEEIASEAFILKHTMDCPGCGVKVIKDTGCDRVRCTRCNNRFKFTAPPYPYSPKPTPPPSRTPQPNRRTGFINKRAA